MKDDDPKRKTLGVYLGVRLSSDDVARLDALLSRFDGALGLSRSHVVRLALAAGLDALESVKSDDFGRALLKSGASGGRGKGR